jgi:hypothetical protein
MTIREGGPVKLAHSSDQSARRRTALIVHTLQHVYGEGASERFKWSES